MLATKKAPGPSCPAPPSHRALSMGRGTAWYDRQPLTGHAGARVDPREDWSDVSPAVGVAQAPGVLSIFPQGLRTGGRALTLQPRLSASGRCGPWEAGAAAQRRADCHTACQSHHLAAAPAVSSGQQRDAGDQTRPLGVVQRGRVRLRRPLGWGGQLSDPCQGQAGTEHERTVSHPHSPSCSTSTSSPGADLGTPAMPCKPWRRLGGSEEST